VSVAQIICPSCVVQLRCCLCGSTNAATPPWPHDQFPVCDDCFVARFVETPNGGPTPDPALLRAHQEHHALAAELGMPTGAPWRLLGYSGADLGQIGEQWQPYSVEVFGDKADVIDVLIPNEDSTKTFHSMTASQRARAKGSEAPNLGVADTLSGIHSPQS
jgi:hypothetical protein